MSLCSAWLVACCLWIRLAFARDIEGAHNPFLIISLTFSRKNHHYHSQRSARSNVDMGHYHQYNAASSIIVNGHKYHPQQAQLQAQYSMHQHPTTPISSFYEYETINPNENYRKIGDHFNPLQNSSSKIFNGSSSVRVSGNTLRRPIPDLKPHQHPGPFITQVFKINKILF